MTQRTRSIWLICLLGGALPGCQHFLGKEIAAPPQFAGKIETPVEVVTPGSYQAPAPAVQNATVERAIDLTQFSEKPSAPFTPREVQVLPLPPAQPPLIPAVTVSAAPAPVTEPFLLALQAMMQNKHEEAVRYLQAYDPQTQDFFLRMLPILPLVGQKKWAYLSHDEVQNVADQLKKIQEDLRPMTGITIGCLSFCEWVKAYGNYKPLGEDHVFVASTNQKPGDLVQLYVELRNFGSQQRTKGIYETVLASSLEIRNARGEVMRTIAFGDEKVPLQSRTPLNDYFKNYSFYVPDVPAGVYQLTIRVRDETVRHASKIASKTVEMRVGGN